MKLLSIRIPLAPSNAVIPDEEDASMRRAALDELRTLIPGLANLKNSIPGIGTQAIDDQLYLTVTLAQAPQLVLNLSHEHWTLGRVVEIDPMALDQIVVKKSIQLTQDLLADAELGIPEALAEWLERFERADKRRAAHRLRRELGRRYEISVFDEPEIVSLPAVEPTQLEEQVRSISLIVTEMKGKRAFWADHLQELREDDILPMNFDPHEVWTLLRLGVARTFASGQRLHRSMEIGLRVVATGRLVTHIVTGSAIAMEVDRIGPQGHGRIEANPLETE